MALGGADAVIAPEQQVGITQTLRRVQAADQGLESLLGQAEFEKGVRLHDQGAGMGRLALLAGRQLRGLAGGAGGFFHSAQAHRLLGKQAQHVGANIKAACLAGKIGGLAGQSDTGSIVTLQSCRFTRCGETFKRPVLIIRVQHMVILPREDAGRGLSLS